MIWYALLEAVVTAAFIFSPLLLVAATPTKVRRKVNATFNRFGF